MLCKFLLLCYCFRTKISGCGKDCEGANCLRGGAPPAPPCGRKPELVEYHQISFGRTSDVRLSFALRNITCSCNTDLMLDSVSAKERLLFGKSLPDFIFVKATLKNCFIYNNFQRHTAEILNDSFIQELRFDRSVAAITMWDMKYL